MDNSKNNTSKKIIIKDGDRLEKNKDFIRTEGFNYLRSKIRMCVRKNSKNKILITSANQGEGKSTCSCNLAVSFAKMGARVLIIDCDLRKPVIYKTFGLSNRNGLSDVLCDLSPLKDCIQQTNYENLSIISAGSELPNPSELLACEEFKNLINDLEEQYDYLIFDCCPINVVSDAESLLEHVDGVVLVTRYKKTTYRDLEEALEKLKFAKANLFGIFYFEKPIQKHKKYGYNEYKYNNKYGNYDK